MRCDSISPSRPSSFITLGYSGRPAPREVTELERTQNRKIRRAGTEEAVRQGLRPHRLEQSAAVRIQFSITVYNWPPQPVTAAGGLFLLGITYLEVEPARISREPARISMEPALFS